MTEKTMLSLLISRWKTVLLFGVLFASLSFAVTAFLPAKYQSEASLIVIQKQVGDNVDAFSAAKSAEFLSDILARIVYTESFFIDVQNAPFSVRRNFSTDPEVRKKQWERAVDVKKTNNTGIIDISVVDPSRIIAEGTAQSIAWNLSVNAQKYHGGEDRVVVKLIDGPITPLRPTVPNVWLATLLGSVVGFAFGMALVIFFPTFRLVSLRSRNVFVHAPSFEQNATNETPF